jgi:hypothetical protein
MTTTRHSMPRRLLAAMACAVLSVLLLAPAAYASGRLVEVDGDFVPEGTSASVTLTYTVTAVDEAVDVIPATALAFGGATIASVDAVTADGEPLEIHAEEGARRTTFELVPPAPIGPGEELTFTLSYEAADAVTARDDETDVIEVPVLAVTWEPEQARPGVFTATLTLPEGDRYAEGFPSVPSAIEQVGGNEVVSYDMIVMPALMRAVATTGSPPFFTYQRTLELLAVVIILGGAVALYYATVVRPRRQRDTPEPVTDRVPA